MDTRARRLRGSALPLSAGRPPRLFWVTDHHVVVRPDFLSRAEDALQASGPEAALQLRAHGLGGRVLWGLAERLAAMADASGSALWVNDRLDVALAVRADGVQLGRLSLRPDATRRLLGRACWVGCSAHGLAEVDACVDEGADLVVLGHVYATDSHPNRAALGLGPLREAATRPRPIVAIGGISDVRVSEVIQAGAWGVAVRTGLWEAADVSASAERYLSALQAALGAKAESKPGARTSGPDQSQR